MCDDKLKALISEREQEILHWLMEGCTNHDIASSLGICQKTVEVHLTRIYRKIGVKTRTQAVLWWMIHIKRFPSLTENEIERK